MSEDRKRIRRHICFYGQVQGVGFRFRASQLARLLDLTGWVRNRDDYVEMEVQGPEEEIQTLIRRLEEDSWIVIDRMDSQETALQQERDFQITW